MGVNDPRYWHALKIKYTYQSGHEGVKKNFYTSDTRDQTQASKRFVAWANLPTQYIN